MKHLRFFACAAALAVLCGYIRAADQTAASTETAATAASDRKSVV